MGGIPTPPSSNSRLTPALGVTSAEQKRYSVTLNTPTTSSRIVGRPAVSYIDTGVVYHLSILDTDPSCDEAHQYHTVVRVSREDDGSQSLQSPSAGSTASNACSIDYVHDETSSPSTMPTLHSSVHSSFSVTWSSNAVTGGSYCLIAIKFGSLSEKAGVALKLCIGTERIRFIDANISCADQYEESFALIRLFDQGNAKAARASEAAEVEQALKNVELELEQTDIELAAMRLSRTGLDAANTKRSKNDKRTSQKRKAPTISDSEAAKMKEREMLTCKMSAARKSLSSARPVQVFRQVVAVQGAETPFHMPSEQMKSSKVPKLGHVGRESSLVKAASVSSSASSTTGTRPKSQGQSFLPMVQTKDNEGVRKTALAKPMSPPATCFYARLENPPNAKYTAIYLLENTFPELLLQIATKLRIHIGTIGIIYYYDQHMAQIIVTESTMGFLPYEQDLIVQLSWIGASSPACVAEAAYGIDSLVGGLYQNPTEISLIGNEDNENQHFLSEGQLNMFDDYLKLQPDDSYSAAIDSPSEFTDDASISMSQMFSTARTTMSSDDGMLFEEDSIEKRLSLGNNGVDHDSYAFDAQNTMPPHPQYASLPTPEPMTLFTSIEIPAEVIPLSPIAELPSIRPLPPGYKAPVSRTYNTQKPRSRKYKPPAFLKIAEADVEPKADKDVQSLERNRVAAMKCRTTRKEREAKLYMESQDKMKLNAALKCEIELLKAEVAKAKELLEGHRVCV